jgi:hypothetical protein
MLLDYGGQPEIVVIVLWPTVVETVTTAVVPLVTLRIDAPSEMALVVVLIGSAQEGIGANVGPGPPIPKVY